MRRLTVKVPIVALVDSNVNSTGIAYVIPGNDDASASIDLITKMISQAVLEGKTKAATIRAAAAPLKKLDAEADDVKVSAKSHDAVQDIDEKVKEELAAKKATEVKK